MAAKGYTHILTRTACGCDLIWKKGPCRCGYGSPHEIILDDPIGPKSNNKCPYETTKRRETQRRLCEDRGWDGCAAAVGTQKRQEKLLPGAPGENVVLPTLIQASGLQYCRESICSNKGVVVCHSSARKLT